MRLMVLIIFISEVEFKKKIGNQEFYEYAKIFDNYYGTSKESVNTLIKNKNDILFDIDWQGTKQLSMFKELKLIKIFLLPPNKSELKRLIQRNQDKKEIVSKRLKAYDEDIVHWSDYEHILINDNLENCFKQIERIILLAKKKID